MGGLYREQGIDVVTKWLISVFQPLVEDIYQRLRDDYLKQAVLLPQVPTASYPSPPPHKSPEGTGPTLSRRSTGERHRSLPPRANEAQQGSGWVVGNMGNCPEVIDQPRSNRRRRRRSSQVDSRSGDSGKEGLVSPRYFGAEITLGTHLLTIRF